MSDVDSKIKRSLARISQAEKELKAALSGLRNKDYMQSLGDFAAKMIKIRTRLGDGVSDQGGHKEKLKPLSSNYVESRKTYAKLSGNTSSSKSNLTRTGQMLDSMNAHDATDRTVKVGPSGDRDDGKQNEDIAKYVTDGNSAKDIQPRPFNNLSDIEKKRVKDKIRLDAKAAIRKALK